MTGSNRTDAAAVVLDLDGGEMLSTCVASLDAQSQPFARIVIFDNGSSDPVDRRIDPSSFRTPVTILRSERNLGYAAGMNGALQNVDEPFVALVNNDAVLDASWLATVRDVLEADASAAGAQAVIRTPDGRIDGAGIDVIDGTFRQTGFGDSSDRIPAYPVEPWGISATAALFRIAALRERPEIFDERLFTYYEDVELCARLRSAGWKFVLAPSALSTHRGSASEARVASMYLRVRNRYLVHRIHPRIGRMSALLLEDAKRIARFALRGRLVAALTVMRAIIAGFTAALGS